MRAALVLMGGPQWPNGPKLKAHSITRLYYEARDPQINAEFFKTLRGLNYEVGIDYDPGWDGYPTAANAAARIVYHLKRLGGIGAQMAVMLDMEHHDPAYAEAILREFRALQPGRNIIWTLESFQAGWFQPSLVALINEYAQLRVAPQFYGGNMTPFAGDQAFKDLILHGVSVSRLVGFYGLRDQYEHPVRIPEWWDGILYVENFEQL
jgi:hypothetical protein